MQYRHVELRQGGFRVSLETSELRGSSQDEPKNLTDLQKVAPSCFTLRQLLKSTVGQDSIINCLADGKSFESAFEDESVRDYLSVSARAQFNNINPLTGEPDIKEDSEVAPFIALATTFDGIAVQEYEGKYYANPDGVVSIAEFIDSLNALDFGLSSLDRAISLDYVSGCDDYFNHGYRRLCYGHSSPFFCLYEREELLRPLTYGELAYIYVVCWRGLGSVYGGDTYFGVNLDWQSESSGSVVLDANGVVSIDLKDYRSDRTMQEYIDDLANGVSPLPLPMLMSHMEMLGLDMYHGDILDEVNRGELCRFLVKAASI